MRILIIILAALLSMTGIQADASDTEEIEDIEIEEIEDISDSPSYYGSENFPRIERAFSLLTANPTRKGSLLFTVDHRNREPIDEEPFHNLFGFDSGGLKIGLGLRYGITDNLDMGFYRANGSAETFDTYDFDLRFRLLNQEDHFLDLAIRPGFTWFSQKDEEDASGGFCQLLISRVFSDRLLFGTGLLYHSDSSNDVKTDNDDDASMAVQALMEWRILPWLAWDTEMSANVDGYGAEYPQVRSGLKFITPRHTFAIVVSNTQYMSAAGVVSDTDRDFGDVVFGFSITRELSQ